MVAENLLYGWRFTHYGYKYSFVYVVNSKRIIGYDNADGQGYHRHDGDKVESYEFEGIDKLWSSFF